MDMVIGILLKKVYVMCPSVLLQLIKLIQKLLLYKMKKKMGRICVCV